MSMFSTLIWWNLIQENRYRNEPSNGIKPKMIRTGQPYPGIRFGQSCLWGNVWHIQKHWGTPGLCEKQGNAECGWSPAVKGAVSLPAMVKMLFLVHRIARENNMIWLPSANKFYTYVLMNNANLVIWTQNNVKSSWLIRVSLIFGVNEQKS